MLAIPVARRASVLRVHLAPISRRSDPRFVDHDEESAPGLPDSVCVCVCVCLCACVHVCACVCVYARVQDGGHGMLAWQALRNAATSMMPCAMLAELGSTRKRFNMMVMVMCAFSTSCSRLRLSLYSLSRSVCLSLAIARSLARSLSLSPPLPPSL